MASITIKIPELTPVQKAFYLWWQLLHEWPLEAAEGAHPSWKGNAARLVKQISELKKLMTPEERVELENKMYPNLKK